MSIRHSTLVRLLRVTVALFLALLLSDALALAQRSRGNVRSSARSSVNRGGGGANIDRSTVNRSTVDRGSVDRNVNRTDINRNVDIDRNIDIDRDIDVHGGYGYHGYHGCCYYGGWSTAAAVATTAAVTAAVVGSIVYSLPPSCTAVVVNGFTYQQCGSVWYQPRITGSSTTYVVVDQPR